MAAALLVGHISADYPTARVWVGDAKGDDVFRPLHATESARYWRFTNTIDGLRNFYEAFQVRMQGDPDRSLNLIWLDDWSGLMMMLPKKEAEEAKAMLSALLTMGRSMGCQALLTLPRGDASLFATGSRDNIGNVLAMGNLRPDSARMMDLDTDALVSVTSIGGGHLLVNGAQQYAVQVPPIRYPETLWTAIKDAVTR